MNYFSHFLIYFCGYSLGLLLFTSLGYYDKWWFHKNYKKKSQFLRSSVTFFCITHNSNWNKLSSIALPLFRTMINACSVTLMWIILTIVSLMSKVTRVHILIKVGSWYQAKSVIHKYSTVSKGSRTKDNMATSIKLIHVCWQYVNYTG